MKNILSSVLKTVGGNKFCGYGALLLTFICGVVLYQVVAMFFDFVQAQITDQQIAAIALRP